MPAGGAIVGDRAFNRAFGAGILNAAGSTSTVDLCTFSKNTAASGGGAFNTVGNTNLNGCTFSANTAQNGGGGIYSYTDLSGHTTSVVNCTFAGNGSAVGGGAIYNVVGMTTQSCTITSNTTGGGLTMSGDGNAVTQVGNSIVVGNSSSDVAYANGTATSIQSTGHNLIGTGNAVSAFNKTGDHTGLSATQVRLDSAGLAGQKRPDRDGSAPLRQPGNRCFRWQHCSGDRPTWLCACRDSGHRRVRIWQQRADPDTKSHASNNRNAYAEPKFDSNANSHCNGNGNGNSKPKFDSKSNSHSELTPEPRQHFNTTSGAGRRQCFDRRFYRDRRAAEASDHPRARPVAACRSQTG